MMVIQCFYKKNNLLCLDIIPKSECGYIRGGRKHLTMVNLGALAKELKKHKKTQLCGVDVMSS